MHRRPSIISYRPKTSSAPDEDTTHPQQEPALKRTASQTFLFDHSDVRGTVLNAVRGAPVYANDERDHSHKSLKQAFSSTGSTARRRVSRPDLLDSLPSETHRRAGVTQAQHYSLRVGSMRRRPAVSVPFPQIHTTSPGAAARQATAAADQDRQNQLRLEQEREAVQRYLTGLSQSVQNNDIIKNNSESAAGSIHAENLTDKEIDDAFEPTAQVGTSALAQLDLQSGIRVGTVICDEPGTVIPVHTIHMPGIRPECDVNTSSQHIDPHTGLNIYSAYLGMSQTLNTTEPLALASTYQPHPLKPTGTDHEYDDSIYSDADSVFSEASNISSKTGISVSRFSSEQIAGATRELLSILKDDETMQSVYTAAIYGDIGRDRFGTVFRRYLRSYARGLKDEAEDSLSYSAARLVSLQARTIVFEICLQYPTGRLRDLSSDNMERHSEEKMDSSSGEDDQRAGLDESAFNELTKLQRLVRLPVPPNSQNEAQKHRIESPDDWGLRDFNTVLGSGDITQIVPSGDSSASLGPLESVFKPSKNESAAVEHIVTAAATILWRVLRHMLLFDENLLRLHSMMVERDLVKVYAELLMRFCLTSDWHGKDAIRITGAPADQLDDICLLSAIRIADDVRALNAHASSSRDSGYIIWPNRSKWLPVKVILVNTTPTILVRTRMEELELVISINEKSQRQLKLDIAVSLLPTHLHEVVLAGDGSPLKITSDSDPSYLNRSKTRAEDYTGVEWDWWPLASRIPTPQPGEVCIEWNFSNTRQHICATKAEAEILEEITAITAFPTTHNQTINYTTAFLYWAESMNHALQHAVPWWRLLSVPIVTVLIRWSVWFLVPFLIGLPLTSFHLTLWSNKRVKAGNQSEASLSGLSNPTGLASKGCGSQNGNVNEIRSSSAPQLPGHEKDPSSHAQGQATIDLLPSARLDSHRVLFGIQGPRWSLDLEQIPVTSLLNDPTFFRELKKRYQKHRSVLKLLLSPFRFRYCRFVKFEKFDVERIISQGDDLPEHPGVKDDYEYAPRPVQLALAQSMARLRAAPAASSPTSLDPKKKTKFDVQSDDVGLVAWGLEADYAISFAYVALYHLVPLLGAFRFWIYWLIQNPGDWQNAAVPVLTVLALFAVIWIPLGKLLSTA